MLRDTIANGASGTIFGAALAVSGVASPLTIVEQFQFRDFRMLKVFLTAAASNALIFRILRGVNFIKLEPRHPKDLGLLGLYDGNVIGGLIMGAGMALAGACPGTSFVQLGDGVGTASTILAGGLLGGILYTASSRLLKPKNQETVRPPCVTVQDKYELDADAVLLLFEGLCASMIALLSVLGPENAMGAMDPLASGLVLGGAQFASLLMTRNTVGVSSSFEEAGNWFWKLAKRSSERPSSRSMTFAGGIVFGSWAMAHLRPGMTQIISVEFPFMRALLGGIFLSFGARLGGGCTSGHGLSGMPTFGLASFVSVASMFAGGIGMTQVLG